MKRKRRPRWLKHLVNDVAYWAIRGLLGAFRLLPKGVGDTFAAGLGRAAYFLDIRDRKLAEKHLGMAYGGALGAAETRNIVRGMFRNIALNFADIARLIGMSADDVLAAFEHHGLDTLKDALARTHGVVALTSHTGNWEMLGAWLSAVNVPVAAIARRLYDPRLEVLLAGSRSDAGMKTITRGDNTREIIRSLKEGYLVGVLIDQDIRKVKGTFVDFFGIPALTATAPALLSLRYGAPMLPVFTYRDGDGKHHACIGEPLEITPSGNFETDVNALTSLASKATEDFIRQHPDQWVWFHQRWKTRPDDGAKHDPGTGERPGLAHDRIPGPCIRGRVLTILAVCTAVMAIAGCSSDDEVVIKRTIGENDPDQMLISPRIVITEKGRTTGIITADSLVVIENRNLTTLDGHVELQFFNHEGVHTTTLTAERGRLWGLYEHVDSLRASGDVLVVSRERGERLETQELRWIFAERLVYADGFVKITAKDGFEQGYGLVAKDDLSSYTLREVSGEVRGRDFTLPAR